MAYSIDLRRAALNAYKELGSYAKAARALGMHWLTVRKIVMDFNEVGEVRPVRMKGGRKPKITKEAMVALTNEISENRDITLMEMVEFLNEKFAISVCNQAISKRLKALGYTFKKKQRDPPSGTPRQ